jgi:hypothetical protein
MCILAPNTTQKENSKDVKILFIAACMSSLGVQSCVWLLGRKGRGDKWLFFFR